MISKAEITRAVKQASAVFAYGSENITHQAFWMGYVEMFSSYEWFTTYLDKLAKVTPKDVQRVARKYLDMSHLQIVAVGDAKKIATVLQQYGQVEMYDSEGKPVKASDGK